MYTALKAKVPFLDINQERDFGYAGYEGMLELARQLALDAGEPGLGGGDRGRPRGSRPRSDRHRDRPKPCCPRVRIHDR